MTSPAWDGRPKNPEVNGYHWLRKGPHSDARPFIADWHGPLFVQGEWSLGGVWYTPKAVSLLWSYLGPVAPYQPATADADLQAARQRQADAVMPLIGPMLDALAGMSNDARASLRNEHFGLYRTLNAVRDAMERE